MFVGLLTHLGCGVCKQADLTPGQVVFCNFTDPMRVDIYLIDGVGLVCIGQGLNLQNPGADVILLSAGQLYDEARQCLNTVTNSTPASPSPTP